MKVIHLVLGKANPLRMNGVNRVAHNHATFQAKLGYDVTLWGITSNLFHDYPPRKYNTVLFRKPLLRLFPGKEIKSAIRKLTSEDIVHIHGGLIPEFFIVTRLLKRKKVPYVYTPHGAFNRIALMKNKWFKKLYIALFEKMILKGAKKVHLLGQSEFDAMDEIIKLNNKFILSNGQDFNELQFEYKQVQPKTSPVFGFCGRLDIYYKALDLLLAAFVSYKNKKGTGEFWLIGDGEGRQQLEMMTKQSNTSQHVKFFGAVFGEEKFNLIANMDAFFHPSRSEGSPTAIIEACALGVPCVVSTATNIGNYVDKYKCGIHLKENTIEQIENAFFECEQLFYSGELKPLGMRAAEMTKKEFDWMLIAKKLTDQYQ